MTFEHFVQVYYKVSETFKDDPDRRTAADMHKPAHVPTEGPSFSQGLMPGPKQTVCYSAWPPVVYIWLYIFGTTTRASYHSPWWGRPHRGFVNAGDVQLTK
jgi:hypothetical protein